VATRKRWSHPYGKRLNQITIAEAEPNAPRQLRLGRVWRVAAIAVQPSHCA
jgi:hypothetical protein